MPPEFGMRYAPDRIARDVDEWLDEDTDYTCLVLVDSKKFVKHLQDHDVYQLLRAGPFGSVVTIDDKQLTSYWIETLRYHHHLVDVDKAIRELYEKFIDEEQLYGSDLYVDLIYACAHPLLFKMTDIMSDLLSRCEYDSQGAPFVLQYVLQFPDSLANYQNRLKELLLQLQRSAYSFWQIVYHIDLLCAWWFNKRITLETEQEWQLLFDIISQYSRFSQPKWTSTIAQMHDYFVSHQMTNMAKQTLTWLQLNTLFQCIPISNRFTNVTIVCCK